MYFYGFEWENIPLITKVYITIIICHGYVKKRTRKAIEDTKKVAQQAKSAEDKLDAAETLQEVKQQATAQQFQDSINTSLDETKENVRKSIDEARSQIPRYTNCRQELSRTSIRIDWKNGRRLHRNSKVSNGFRL